MAGDGIGMIAAIRKVEAEVSEKGKMVQKVMAELGTETLKGKNSKRCMNANFVESIAHFLSWPKIWNLFRRQPSSKDLQDYRLSMTF